MEYFLGLKSNTCSIHGACPTRGVKPPCSNHLQVAKGHFVGAQCHHVLKTMLICHLRNIKIALLVICPRLMHVS
jgi:hypothetical protein